MDLDPHRLRQWFGDWAGAAHFRGGLFNRVVDLDEAGATAKISGDGFLDFLARRLGIVFKQALGGHDKARGTEAALRTAAL